MEIRFSTIGCKATLIVLVVDTIFPRRGVGECNGGHGGDKLVVLSRAVLFLFLTLVMLFALLECRYSKNETMRIPTSVLPPISRNFQFQTCWRGEEQLPYIGFITP